MAGHLGRRLHRRLKDAIDAPAPKPPPPHAPGRRVLNSQHVVITTAGISDGGRTYYGGTVTQFNANTATGETLGDVWVTDLNGTELSAGSHYPAHQSGDRTVNGQTRTVFVTAELPGTTTGGGSGFSDTYTLYLMFQGATAVGLNIRQAVFTKQVDQPFYFLSDPGLISPNLSGASTTAEIEMFGAYIEVEAINEATYGFATAMRLHLPSLTIAPVSNAAGYEDFLGFWPILRSNSDDRRINNNVAGPPQWYPEQFTAPGGPGVPTWACKVDPANTFGLTRSTNSLGTTVNGTPAAGAWLFGTG